MDTQQIADYLEKYNIKSKEQLASHIEQLKRNTNPNTRLISELVWALEDDTSFFNSFCGQNTIEGNKHGGTDATRTIILKPSEKENKSEQKYIIVPDHSEYYNTEKLVFKKYTGEAFTDDTWDGYIKIKKEDEIITDVKQEKRSAEHLDEVLEELEKVVKIEELEVALDELFEFIKDNKKEWVTNMTGDISEEEIKLIVSFPDGSRIQTKGFKNVKEAKESLRIEDWDSYTIYKGKNLVECRSKDFCPQKEFKTEENKGMSTRLKAQQEKEVIDNWEKREGVKQNNEGVKLNELKPQLSLLFKQFPQALEAISRCSEYGHEKYKETDLDYLNFKRVKEGSKAYADAGLRHRLQKGVDLESMLPHCYHVAWNALAELELILENK